MVLSVPVRKPEEFVTSKSTRQTKPARPAKPTKPAKPAKLWLELGTTSQQYAENSEYIAAQNDGDSIKQEGTDTDDEEDLSGSEQQNIVAKQGIKEDVDHESSSSEDEAKANLAETHGGSIAAGSTSRNHATGAAKSERTRYDPKQDDDGSMETSANRNGKLSPKDAEEWRSTSHVESATEREDDAADDSGNPTDVETTDAEKYNKVHRGGAFNRTIFNEPSDTDGEVTHELRSMRASGKRGILNANEIPKSAGRMLPPSSRPQAKRKGRNSPCNSPEKKNRKISSGSELRRRVLESEPE